MMWKACPSELGSMSGFQSVGRRDRFVRGKLGIRSNGIAFGCSERMYRKCIRNGALLSLALMTVRNCERVVFRCASRVRQEYVSSLFSPFSEQSFLQSSPTILWALGQVTSMKQDIPVINERFNLTLGRPVLPFSGRWKQDFMRQSRKLQLLSCQV